MMGKTLQESQTRTTRLAEEAEDGTEAKESVTKAMKSQNLRLSEVRVEVTDAE